MDADDVFNPRLYEGVRKPLLEAEPMPRACYFSPAFFEREMERIFMKVWTFIGRADEIAEPGDYAVLDHLAGGPIIVLMDRDGALRAYANACRHRGSRLLSGKANCGKAIVCPYHGWSYALSGEIVGAPEMEKSRGFDRSAYGLIPVRLETWGGFLFVNFDGDAEPLAEYLGDMPEQFAPYACEELVCVRRKDYDLAVNWKLYLENFEFYHTGRVHGDTVGMQKGSLEATQGQWLNLYMPAEKTIAVLAGDEPPFPYIRTLAGKSAKGTFFPFILPNVYFAATQDCMWWINAYPLAVERTRMSLGFCFPRSTVALPHFKTDVQRYFDRWDVSMPQDDAAVERQHMGLRSLLWSPGRLSWAEPAIHVFDNWVLDRVL